jgi:hypothetical protein
MGMRIDEAGHHGQAFGVDYLARRPADLADCGDLAARDAEVGLVARRAGTVDDRFVADDQVVIHNAAVPL